MFLVENFKIGNLLFRALKAGGPNKLRYFVGDKEMPRFEELREILGQILQESPNCYWLYDQILNRLREVRPDILKGLEERGDKGYGRGGGEYYGPDSAIAHCLRDWHECVDVQYLSGRDLRVADIQADNDAMAIYRWIGST